MTNKFNLFNWAKQGAKLLLPATLAGYGYHQSSSTEMPGTQEKVHNFDNGHQPNVSFSPHINFQYAPSTKIVHLCEEHHAPPPLAQEEQESIELLGMQEYNES